MSTLKVNSITNNGNAINFTTDLAIGSGKAIREYYSQGIEPLLASNGAVWWDTTNNTYKILLDDTWYTVTYLVPPPSFLGDRGIFAGGQSSNVIDYVTIPTTSNATDFGDLLTTVSGLGASSNGIRGVFGTGALQYITISTISNAISFGNLTVTRSELAATSGTTRGIFAGGGVYPTEYNIIDYITIATAGNAIDFGDLTAATYGLAACSNSTYSIFAGGATDLDVGTATNVISYVITDTLSNATSFGTLTAARYRPAGLSDGVKGVFAGGGSNGNYNSGLNIIDYITISTTSNATDFGDLISARNYTAGTSNSTRGVVGGGYDTSMTQLNSIEYITIATTSNAASFGTLTTSRNNLSACSGN